MAADVQMKTAMLIVEGAGNFADFDADNAIRALTACSCVFYRRHIAADIVVGLLAAGYKIERTG